jgi:hypothetical protein
MSNPIKQEIILQPDGNFYKRTVVTTLIKSQADAVQRVKSKPVFNVVDIPIAPKTNIAMFVGANSKKRYLFRQVDQFPLRGGVLKKHGEDYCLSINGAPYMRNDEENEIQTRDMNDGNGLLWRPTALGFKMYYMFQYSSVEERGRAPYIVSNSAPHVFLYHSGLKASFVPNLPNVYDSGLICTGDDFTDSETTVHKLLATNEYELNHSYCNNDLRTSSHFEANYVKFDEHGGTLPINDELMPQDAKGNPFFIAPTLEPILEYTKWLKSMNR